MISRRRKSPTRKLAFQTLNRREMLAGDLHNSYLPQDVNNDLVVSPADMLSVIDFLGEQRWNQSTGNNATTNSSYPDVDNNGVITPNDLLETINHLVEKPDSYLIRLANDTAPNETTNNDRITSDATLEGHIHWPVDSDPETRKAFLRRVDPYAGSEEIEITSYLVDDYFKVPDDEVDALLKTSRFGEFGHPVTIELQIDAEGISPTMRRPSLSITYDTKAPVIHLPDSVSRNSDALSLTIFETSELAESSLADFSISLADASSSQVDHELRDRASFTLIDVPLQDAGFSSDDPVHLFFNGTLQDIAGNVTQVDAGYRWERDDSAGVPGFDLSQTWLATPESGYTFANESFATNIYQRVTIPLPQNGNPVLVPVVPDGVTNSDDASYQYVSLYNIDWLQGTAEIVIPSDALSGDILDSSGEVLTSLALVRDRGGISLGDDPLTFKSTGYGIPGGFATDEGFAYRYRLLTPQESEAWRDDGVVPFFTREETLAWPLTTEGETIDRLGFRDVQVASTGGVSEPFSLPAVPTGRSIAALTATQTKDIIWVASEGRVEKIDFANAEPLIQLDQNKLRVGVPDSAANALKADFTVNEVAIVPGVAFKDVYEPVEGSAAPVDDSEYLVLWFEHQVSPRAWVVDPSIGQTIGFISDSIAGDSDGKQFLSAAFDKNRHSWFRVSEDLTRWEERAIASGDVINDGSVLGIPLYTSQTQLRDQKRLIWNAATEEVELLTHDGLSSSRDFDSRHFDFQKREFVVGSSPKFRRSTSIRIGDDDQQQIVTYEIGTDTRLLTKLVSSVNETDDAHSKPQISGIMATAEVGVATDEAIASANPGQLIEVQGSNLTSNVRLNFDLRWITDIARTFAWPTIVSESATLPVAVSDDGTTATYRVPSHAVSGPVNLVGSDESVDLQIVPAIKRSQYPERIDRQTLLDDFEVLGFAGDQYELRIDGKQIAGCFGADLSQPCEDFTSATGEVATYISSTRTSVGHRDIRVLESIEVVTTGGSHTVSVTPNKVIAPLKIDKMNDVIPVFGKAFQYSELQPYQVIAGSRLQVSLKRPDSLDNTTDEDHPWPMWALFDLLIPLEGTSEIRSDRVVRGFCVEDGVYDVPLPADFTGGWIVPVDTLVRNSTEASEIGLALEVAPTVLAAAGDSTVAGSNVLIHGVNLDGATIAVDGVETDPILVKPHNAVGELRTYHFVIPDTVTSGAIVISKNDVVARLDRLEPWWVDEQIPIADVGTPVFPDLPSVNALQNFDFKFQRRESEDSSGEFLDPGFVAIDTRGLNVHSSHFRDVGNEMTGGVEDANGIGRFDSTSFHPFVFGTLGDDLLHLIPTVPNASPIVMFEDDSGSLAFGFPVSPDALRSSSYPLTSSSTRITWGENQWLLDPGRSEFHGQRISGRLIQKLPKLIASDDSQSLYLSPRGPFANYVSSVVFFAETLDDVPEGPILVDNLWGSFELPLAASNDQATSYFSASEAFRGIPADPSLPSSNVLSSIAVPDDSQGFFFPTLEGNVLGSTRTGNSSGSQFVYVPYEAVTGDVLIGLSDRTEFLQIVPSISRRYTNQAGTFYFEVSGVDETSQLHIGQHTLALSDDELSSKEFFVKLSDPRFASLSVSDFEGDIYVTSRGGTSNIVSFE
ncbi:MAG: dockerin type I domain-containing protein [Pirellulaceae bacterium]